MSSFSFNVDEQEKAEPRYKLHPAGNYKAVITKVVERSSKSNASNRFFMYQLETDEGKINDIINYMNVNSEVEKRACSALADVCFACGTDKKDFKSTDEIIEHCEGKDVYIRVYHTKPKDSSDPESKVGGYFNTKKESRSGVVAKDTKTTSVVNSSEEVLPF